MQDPDEEECNSGSREAGRRVDETNINDTVRDVQMDIPVLNYKRCIERNGNEIQDSKH